MRSRREFLTTAVAGLVVLAGQIPLVRSARADYESITSLGARLRERKASALEYAAERGYTSFLSTFSSPMRNETPWGKFEAARYALRSRLNDRTIADMFSDRRFRIESYVLNKLLHDNPLGGVPGGPESPIMLLELFDKSTRLADAMDKSAYSFTHEGVTYGVTDKEKSLIRERLGARMRFGALSQVMDSAIAFLDTSFFLGDPKGEKVVSLIKKEGQEAAHTFITRIEDEILTPLNNPYMKTFDAAFGAFDFAAVTRQITEARRARFLGPERKNGVIEMNNMTMEETSIRNLVASLQEEPVYDTSRENELFMHWYTLAREEEKNPTARKILINQALPYGKRVLLLSDDPSRKEMVSSLTKMLEDVLGNQ